MPPVLAGRGAEVDEVVSAVESGPEERYYMSAFTGKRGVGKTVCMDAVAERIEAGGQKWCTVHVQTVKEENLLEQIARALPEDLAGSPWKRLGRPFKQFEKQLTVSLNLGVVSGSVALTERGHSPVPEMNAGRFQQLLMDTGRFAANHDVGLLLVVDEASSMNQASSRGLCAALQMVNRRLYPVAAMFAGLSDLRDVIIRSGSGTFSNRLEYVSIGDLSIEETKVALVEPALARGVLWTPEALAQAVSLSEGYPYYVQLLGYETWVAGAARTGGGELHQLTADDVERGAQRWQKTIGEQFQAVWEGLPPGQRAVLAVVAEDRSAEGVHYVEVARRLGRPEKSVHNAKTALINSTLVESPDRAWMKIRDEPFRRWVLHRVKTEGQPAPAHHRARELAQARQARPERGVGR